VEYIDGGGGGAAELTVETQHMAWLMWFYAIFRWKSNIRSLSNFSGPRKLIQRFPRPRLPGYAHQGNRIVKLPACASCDVFKPIDRLTSFPYFFSFKEFRRNPPDTACQGDTMRPSKKAGEEDNRGSQSGD